MVRRLGGGKSRVARARIRPRLRERSPTPFAYPPWRARGGRYEGGASAEREKCEDGSLWADPIWLAVAAAEKGYRMGHSHAMAHKHGEESHGSNGNDA